jgi:hypothetical protein
MRRVGILYDDDEPSPRDPGAACDRCGRVGVVARLTREDEVPPIVERLCDDCWPVRQEELERVPATTTTRWAMAVRSWAHVRRFLGLITQPPGRTSPAPPDVLAELADEILRRAPEIGAQIPPDIAAFIRQHRPPAA